MSHPGHEAHDPDLGPDAHAGHDKHEGHTPEVFRNRFWVALVLTLPVVFWAEPLQELMGYEAPTFAGSTWISPVLGTVIFLYGGWTFVQGAWDELRARLPGMMTLIALAISVAFIFSWVVQLGLLDAEALWWELATLVTIMLLGWLAAGYNIVAIPLAAGVLAGWGILLTPALGAVFMSASTIVVSLNAQLLRRVKL